MAVPLPAAPADELEPIAAPASAIARMDASASSSSTYDTGSTSGASLEYPLAYSFAWFIAAAAGWTTRNRGGRRYTGAMHGLEDGARRRKD